MAANGYKIGPVLGRIRLLLTSPDIKEFMKKVSVFDHAEGQGNASWLMARPFMQVRLLTLAGKPLIRNNVLQRDRC
jgi:hypothetical protein